MTKAMTTAKDLAWKAYNDGMKHINPDYCNKYTETEQKQRFEHWWSDNFIYGEHKDSFRPEINVYVGNKRYIQAE
ncbi:MAG: hypothetical protein WC428_02640 [Candidatus Paceibacterota bacterium]